MKTAAVVSVLFLVLFTKTYQELTLEQKQKIVRYRDECIAETKVIPEYIDRANKGDFVDDGNLKCFAKCFYQKAGFVGENGELLPDVIKARIPTVNRERSLSIIEKCIKLKGKDDCDTVFQVHKCYFENSNKEDEDYRD